MAFDFLFKPDVEKLKAKKDVKGLIKALHYKKDYKVRWRAAEALGEIGDARAVEPLIAVSLQDENAGVRWGAAEALGKIGDARAIKSLMGALKDKDVREEAIRALRRIGDVRAVKPLLNETEWIYYLIATEKWDEVVKIGKPAVELLIDALKDRYWNVRVCAVKALGDIGDARAVEPLIVILKRKYEDRDVREEAIRALGRIGDLRAVKPLLNETEWMSYLITIEKWDELVKIGKPAVKPLIGVSEHEDTDVRACAAETLGKIGDVRAIEPLIAALKDRYWNVRVCAAKALGEIGDTRAVKPLMAALKDENMDVHKAAEKAILRIHEPAVKSVIDAIEK